MQRHVNVPIKTLLIFHRHWNILIINQDLKEGYNNYQENFRVWTCPTTSVLILLAIYHVLCKTKDLYLTKKNIHLILVDKQNLYFSSFGGG